MHLAVTVTDSRLPILLLFPPPPLLAAVVLLLPLVDVLPAAEAPLANFGGLLAILSSCATCTRDGDQSSLAAAGHCSGVGVVPVLRQKHPHGKRNINNLQNR